MKAIPFKYANQVLQPSKQKYSKNVTIVSPLPIWTDGERCVSCWKMSWRERLSALFFGRVWLALLSGRTQPPACLITHRRYFRKD